MARRRLFRLRPRGRAALAADVVEELEAHVALAAEHLVARGVPPERALAQARARFGVDYDDALRTLTASAQQREKRMDRRERLAGLRQDVRLALHHVRRAPGFAAVVALTLALGIGATTAIFTVVRAVVLRELPFPAPERLVRVWATNQARGETRAAVSVPDLEDWRRAIAGTSVERVAAFSTLPSGLVLLDGGEPTSLRTAFVSEDFFGTLGARPEAGRTTLPGEHVDGRDRVVVLSHALWRARFNGDRAIVGRTVQLNDEPFTVVGVMPPSMRFPEDPEIWTPLTVVPASGIPRDRGGRWLQVIARLRPDATPARAEADLGVIAARLAREYPDANGGWTGVSVVPLRDAIAGKARGRLLVLLGAVALVLLLACVNVANLVLARSTLRGREMAVRTALGAGRGRLAAQLLTESLVLSLAGGALGLALAWRGSAWLVSQSAVWLPPTADVRPDAAVLAFAFGLSLVTGVGFGLVPATRPLGDVASTLREGGRANTGGAATQGLRRAFVAAEVALAVTLAVGAGLFVKSFARLSAVDAGFDVEHTVYARMSLPRSRYASSEVYLPAARRMLERVQAIPGVIAAAEVKDAPLRAGNAGEMYSLQIPGRAPTRDEAEPRANVLPVSPGFLRALAVPLRAGRDLVEQDGDTASAAVVLSEAVARAYWPNREPGRVVGEEIRFAGYHARVVGVAADVRYQHLDSAAWRGIYVPQTLVTRRIVSIVARTAGDPARLVGPLRDAIRAVDPDQPIAELGTLRDAAADRVAAQRFVTLLVGLFGVVALLLAALGVYAVVAFVVGQRTRDIGVRLALGASRHDVAAWTLRTGMTPVGVGLALGLAAAFAGARLLSAQLYDVSATDPLVFAAVVAVLAVVALLASSVPAARATRVGPLEALRGD
jgi:predicted permease